MAKILVIDDDATTCSLVKTYLDRLKHEILVAADGVNGLVTALENRPDMVLCDIGMPKLDGFGVLAALRNDARTAKVPFVFLTASEDKQNLRRAMRNGAEDYLTKPVIPKDLYEAVDNCLGQKTGKLAKLNLTDSCRVQNKDNVDTTQTNAFAEMLSLETIEGCISKETRKASVLFFGICNFNVISNILEPAEVNELLHTFFSKACEPVLQKDGWVVKMLGSSVLAMFEPGVNEEEHHSVRALHAAALIALAATSFQTWINQRFAKRGLPRLIIGAGLHTGEVAVCNIDSKEHRGPITLGNTVNTAFQIGRMANKLGWSIVADSAIIQAAGDHFEWGARRSISIPGSASPADVVEVLGVKSHAESSMKERGHCHCIRQAILSNSAAAQAANKPTNPSGAHNAQGLPEIDGYRILRMIGQGGMSSVYLGESVAIGGTQVIKVMSINNEDDPGALQRFIEEYALVSQVHHRNVAKIYHQGFTDSNAFIAMEYLSGGDLREHIASGLEPAVALSYLLQTAAALEAVHSIGIIHRDLKPGNLMLRADGSLALVDFGISKILTSNLSTTNKGEILGTPYYLSPEQVLGHNISVRTDIYSLGAVFYEMLTGKKAYTAQDAQSLLAQHVAAPVPTLPETLAPLQDLLNRMMAKNPDERFASATELRQFAMRAASQFGVATEDTMNSKNTMQLRGAMQSSAPDKLEKTHRLSNIR